MKKTSDTKHRRPAPDDMRAEYQFDYREARPNRFAARIKGSTIAVILDPDVAAVFQGIRGREFNAAIRHIGAAGRRQAQLQPRLTNRPGDGQNHAAPEPPSRERAPRRCQARRWRALTRKS